MTNQAILTNTNHTHFWCAKSRNATGKLTINHSVTSNINLSHDTDWFKIHLTAGQQVTFNLKGKPTNSGTLPDPYLRGIYDSTGNPIPNTTNDDGGIKLNSKVTFTASTSANYYVSAGAFSTRTGTYTLSATATGHTNSGTITNNAYLYDANGNMTQNNNKSIQWTSFNKPKKFQKAGDTTTFTYAPDRSRYQKVQTSTTNNTLITTTYIDKLYEQIKQNTNTEHKHFIYADGQLIAIHIKAQNTDALNHPSDNNNNIRIFITNANGTSITINRPNTKVRIDGSSGNDSIYVSAGIISASRLSATGGHDKIYLAGNFADYKQNRRDSQYTFSRGSGNNLEQVTFQLSNGDKLYFADGSIALDFNLHTNTTTHPTTYKDFTQNDLNPNETSPSTFPTNSNNSSGYKTFQKIPDKTRYLHYDNLGSIDTITDGQGNIVERMAYTAFGQRRQGDWRAADPHLPIIPKLTNRGFTGHEHIDEMGFIHMNGRVYDPSIGRFLSADPNVFHPYNTQDYNRYSYTTNNPLKYVDMNGFGWFSKLFKSIVKFSHSFVSIVFELKPVKNFFRDNAWARTLGTIVAGYYGGL